MLTLLWLPLVHRAAKWLRCRWADGSLLWKRLRGSAPRARQGKAPAKASADPSGLLGLPRFSSILFSKTWHAFVQTSPRLAARGRSVMPIGQGRCPRDVTNLWTFVTELDHDSLMAMFTHCVALTVNAVNLPWERKPRALARLAAFASTRAASQLQASNCSAASHVLLLHFAPSEPAVSHSR